MFLGWLVILVTVLVFVRFVRNNPSVCWQLRDTSPMTLLALLTGYSAMIVVLAMLYKVMTDICKVQLPTKENLLLTMYSSVVNFFGPLQSGPGFRMVYLKKKYHINVPAYLGVSLLYYMCFAIMSGLLLLSGWLGWWVLAALGLGIIFAQGAMPRFLRYPFIMKRIPKVLPLLSFAILAGLSALQVLVVALIYFMELRSIDSGVTFAQALVYTGAANFALFVSLTPGALGFRESFLYFSRSLHGINEQTIVAANILDRGVYVVFLGILFVVILAMHGHQKFKKVAEEV